MHLGKPQGLQGLTMKSSFQSFHDSGVEHGLGIVLAFIPTSDALFKHVCQGEGSDSRQMTLTATQKCLA